MFIKIEQVIVIVVLIKICANIETINKFISYACIKIKQVKLKLGFSLFRNYTSNV